jgi:hypothetical protein
VTVLVDLTKRNRFRLGVAVVVIAGVAGAATSAQAQPFDQFHYDESGGEVIDGFCGDLQVSTEFHDSGVVVGRVTGRDRTLRYTQTRHGEVTWTNVATGKGFTAIWNVTNQDLRATVNGDGTLSIFWQITGPEKLYGPDGERLYTAVGNTTWLTIIDYGGTLTDPSDDVVVDTAFLGLHGPPPPDTDFCDAFHALTGEASTRSDSAT